MDFLAIDQESLKKLREAAADLPPFTITFTDPKDCQQMVSAFILLGCGGNINQANEVAVKLALVCKTYGIEKGVRLWCEAGTQANFKLPKFIEPVLIHYFKHIDSK